MSRRLLAAGVAAAALVAVVVHLSSARPTAAAVVEWEDLAGNFAGDDREEVFSYGAGDMADGMVTWDNGGVSGGNLTVETFPFTVSGSYDPFVGNFDDDPFDEIIWYRPGRGRDYLWNFTSLGSADSTPLTINGSSYQPVAGDLTGDGVDDVLWYAPGSARDFLWEYNADGTYVSTERTINGSYTPLVGSFGVDATDDIFWYVPGSGRDYLWDFVAGTTNYRNSAPYQVRGAYRPFVLDIFNDGWQGDDIFWYAPGSGPESLWNFIRGTLTVLTDGPVNGDYGVVAGDFLGDGHDDISWAGTEGFYFWDHAPTGEPGVVTRYEYKAVPAANAARAGGDAGGSGLLGADTGPTGVSATETTMFGRARG